MVRGVGRGRPVTRCDHGDGRRREVVRVSLPAAGPYSPDRYGSFMPVFDPEIDEVPARVLFEGDGTGRRLKLQKIPGTWVRLPPEQQERLRKPGAQPDQAPGTHPGHRAHDGARAKHGRRSHGD